jgi:arylsulfatase A-like enzyme
MKRLFAPAVWLIAALPSISSVSAQQPEPELNYSIVDVEPNAAQPAHPPSYRRNADGTVEDQVTGLTWTQPSARKMSYAEAVADAQSCAIGGHRDWRLPTIKELYSLILFSGIDPNPQARDSRRLTPFLDRKVFTEFRYGDLGKGERIIDSQFATATEYVSTTMNGNSTMFGVNFADGRIKGYPKQRRRSGQGGYFVMYVRGNLEYGRNQFHNNGDGTVSDLATGLTWMKDDCGKALDWNQAHQYASTLKLAGHSDWRLPTAKELHSIVDYTRSPDTTKSAAIDPVFDATKIKNEGGARDWGQYWTSTQHRNSRGQESMVYICFGRSLGFMKGRRGGQSQLLDVHGAGAQRSEPKAGDPSRYPEGRGPQGDVMRFFNMVRCVRTTTLPPQIDQPNIVLILADDLGWTGLSIAMDGNKSGAEVSTGMDENRSGAKSDYYQTPNIAALAREGMRFSRAYSPAALCTPSRAAILTGKTPARLNITTPGAGRSKANADRKLIPARSQNYLPADEITIAEALAKRGYATAHFGKWHLGGSGPGDHGFDFSDGATGNDPVNAGPNNPKDIHGITNRSIEFMQKQVSNGKPFYLQLSHYAVHGPSEASVESTRRFENLPTGRIHKDVEFSAMTYDLDISVGNLMQAIDELGFADNTYVIFYSDNGAPGNRRRPNNAPLAGGKGGFHEGGIRVPLIVRGPRVAASSTSSAAVVGQDFFPTFCDLAGVNQTSAADGMSLVPLLHDLDGARMSNGSDRPVEADGARKDLEVTSNNNFSQRPILFHFPHYGQSPKQIPQSALIVGDDKLIRNDESGEVFLFDLGMDPSERTNLAKKDGVKAKRMIAQLDQLLQSCGAQMPKTNPSYSKN